MSTTISGTSGVTFPDSTSMQTGQQACKAWVNFKGTGTVEIRGSYNVSSITDNGTGNYTVNFTTAMVDANYCPVFGNEGGFDVQRYQTSQTRNTGDYRVETGYQATNGSLNQADIGTVLVTIFSN
jgi:hypothetical protein